jgi:hypothetical protein
MIQGVYYPTKCKEAVAESATASFTTLFDLFY